jgi:hypothetical protein
MCNPNSKTAGEKPHPTDRDDRRIEANEIEPDERIVATPLRRRFDA